MIKINWYNIINVANAISDDDVISGPVNDFIEAYYHSEEADLESQGK